MNARKTMTDLRVLDRKSAEDAFAEMANLHAELHCLEAEYETALQHLKREFEQESASIERAFAHYEGKLDAFILANPGEFRKPRAIRTLHGEFGMRKGTKTTIADKGKALADCKEQGLAGCIKVKESLLVAELKKLLEANPDLRIAGVTVLSGDVTFHKFDKVFTERAVAQITAGRTAQEESTHETSAAG